MMAEAPALPTALAEGPELPTAMDQAPDPAEPDPLNPTADEEAAVDALLGLLTGAADGSADLVESLDGLRQAAEARVEAEEDVIPPESDNEERFIDSEPEAPDPDPVPKATKRKVRTPQEREALADEKAVKRVQAWRQKHGCKCVEGDCLDQFDAETLTREMVVFRSMTEPERAAAMRYSLSMIAAPHGEVNTVSAAKRQKTQPPPSLHKRARYANVPDGKRRMQIAYAFHGRRVCVHAFSAIFQMESSLIHLLAQDVCTEYESPTPRKATNVGTRSVQTKIAVSFIKGMARDHAMQQPSGRGGGTKEEPVLFFMSHNTKTTLYRMYKAQFPELVEAAVFKGAAPKVPLQTTSFFQVWRQRCPNIRVFASGSDFCDRCTGFRNQHQPSVEEVEGFQQHVVRYREERQVYNDRRAEAKDGGQAADSLHIIFDYAGDTQRLAACHHATLFCPCSCFPLHRRERPSASSAETARAGKTRLTVMPPPPRPRKAPVTLVPVALAVCYTTHGRWFSQCRHDCHRCSSSLRSRTISSAATSPTSTRPLSSPCRRATGRNPRAPTPSVPWSSTLYSDQRCRP